MTDVGLQRHGNEWRLWVIWRSCEHRHPEHDLISHFWLQQAVKERRVAAARIVERGALLRRQMQIECRNVVSDLFGSAYAHQCGCDASSATYSAGALDMLQERIFPAAIIAVIVRSTSSAGVIPSHTCTR